MRISIFAPRVFLDPEVATDHWVRIINDRSLLRTGIIGSVIAAICCFTPFLGVLFAALGITALIGAWLDFVLLPALAFFLIHTGYAAYRLKRSPDNR